MFGTIATPHNLIISYALLLLSDRPTFPRDPFVGIVALTVDILMTITWSSPPHNLITSVQLNLDGTADFQGTNRRPDTPLASQNPIFQTLFRGILEKLCKIFRRQVWYKCQARPRDAFVYEQLPQAHREQTEIIELF
jgi:hypothetical protein